MFGFFFFIGQTGKGKDEEMHRVDSSSKVNNIKAKNSQIEFSAIYTFLRREKNSLFYLYDHINSLPNITNDLKINNKPENLF